MFVTELKDPTTMYADDLEDLEELDEHMEAYIKLDEEMHSQKPKEKPKKN